MAKDRTLLGVQSKPQSDFENRGPGRNNHNHINSMRFVPHVEGSTAFLCLQRPEQACAE